MKRSFFAVYRLLAWEAFKRSAEMLAIGLVPVLIARGLFHSYLTPNMLQTLALLLPVVMFFLAINSGSGVIKNNLNWLQLLPFSKRSLVFLVAAFNVTSLCLTLLAVAVNEAVFLAAFKLLSREKLLLVQQALRPTLNMLRARPVVFNVAVMVSFVVCLVAILFYLSPKGNPWQILKRRHYALASVILVGGYKLWTSPFGILVLLNFFIFGLLAYTWAEGLPLSRRAARKAYLGCCGFAFLLVTTFYVAAARNTHTNDYQRAISNLRFLGPFARTPDIQLLAKWMEDNDHGVTDVRFLRQAILDQAPDRLLHARKGGVNLGRALASKKDVFTVTETLEMFDPKSVGMEEIRLVLRALDRTQFNYSNSVTLSRLIAAELTPEQMMQLLSSGRESDNLFALLRARYDRQEIFIGAIIANLGMYSDLATYYALGTLSVLTGHPYTLKEWLKLTTKSSLPKFYNPSCADFNPAGPAGSDALWNVCKRDATQRNDPYRVAGFEQRAWHTWPSSPVSPPAQ